VLQEVGAVGGLRMACAMEGPAGEVPTPLWRAPFALGEGQWVLPARVGGRTRVMGYRLPGVGEAAGGWTAAGGSMQGDNRERRVADARWQALPGLAP
jgi:hypothetical protein